jgi:uncharacterized Zn-finger protein
MSDVYEVVFGGKEYDNPEDSSEMEPRECQIFDCILEARAFAKEKITEEHPRVWIEMWRTGKACPILVEVTE